LSAQTGALLLEAARSAFAEAMQVTLILCAVVSALTEVMVVVMLRRVRGRRPEMPSDRGRPRTRPNRRARMEIAAAPKNVL